MWLALTIASSLAIGAGLAGRIWRRDDPQRPFPSELALYAVVIGSCLWLSSTWVIALVHQLHRPVLIGRAILFSAVAVMLFFPERHDLMRRLLERRTIDRGVAIRYAVVLLPLLLWMQYTVWRGAGLPPLSFDALSYHLPKAVFYMRASGYDALRDLRFVFGWRPMNYELLLADGLIIDMTDAYTEWISTFFFAGFVLSAAAMSERWWGRNAMAALMTAILTAASPVLLLHAADYKNDVMMAFFVTAGLVAAGRWLSWRDVAALATSLAAFSAAVGTKTHAAIVVALLLPFLLWPLIRRREMKRLASVVAFGLAAFLVLGGAAYVSKVAERFEPRGSAVEGGSVTAQKYGDWANLWKGPYLLLSAPFSTDSTALVIPGQRQPSIWHRYELYYSELGIPFALCAFAVPFCIARFGGWERIIVTMVTFGTVAVILPVQYVPAGRFIAMLPRFVLFLVPVVFSWTIPPLVTWCRERRPVLCDAALYAGTLCFAVYAVLCTVNNTFAPFVLVDRGSDDGSLASNRRSAILKLDRAAGPRDAVLLDVDTASLTYLAFGKALTRDVEFVRPGKGPVVVPANVRWIVVDRIWNLVWGHRQFRELSQASQYLGRGEPTEEDLRVLRQFWNDPQFELVYFEPRAMQAVFRRRDVR